MWYISRMRKKSIIIAFLVVLIDQISKLVVDNVFVLGKLKTIVPNFFYLTKMYNEGAAWNLFDGAVNVLVIVSIIAFLFLFRYQRVLKNNIRNIVAFALIYGGLIGNLIDRVIYGYVIDFIELHFGNYIFPVFNIADMAIVCGVILLLVAIIKGEEHDSNSK